MSSLRLINRIRRQNIRKTSSNQKSVVPAIGNGGGWGEGRSVQKTLSSWSEARAQSGRSKAGNCLIQNHPSCRGPRREGGRHWPTSNLDEDPWAPLHPRSPEAPLPPNVSGLRRTNLYASSPISHLALGPRTNDKVTSTVTAST